MSETTAAEVYEECCKMIDATYQNAVLGNEEAANGASERQLTEDVKGVKAKIDEEDSITANDCAKVAKCVIAVWTWRVRQIHDLQWQYEDVRNVSHSKEGGGEGAALDKRVMLDDGDSAAMLGLPSVSFLGFS
jgi:hypothetical protein